MTTTIDAVAKVFARGAALSVQQGTPREIVAEALFRAAIAILIIQDGNESTVATLRDAADRLAGVDDEPNDNAPLAN